MMFRFGCGHLTKDPEVHEASWGARLIYQEVVEGFSGVVPDRQTPDGDPEVVRTLFPVIETATEEFRKVKYTLPQDSRGRFCWRDGRALVVMSPQGSYGYLYVTAVLEREGHEGETKLYDFEGASGVKWIPLEGNWPPEVVEAKRQARIKSAQENLVWAKRDLKWAEDEFRRAPSPRAATIRRKKVDEAQAEVDKLERIIAEQEEEVSYAG